MYRNYMGRIRVSETNDPESKFNIAVPSGRLNRSTVRIGQNEGKEAENELRKLFGADRSYYEWWDQQRNEILSIIEMHLIESKRVLEVYKQFEPLICGSQGEKVKKFLERVDQEEKIQRSQDRDYAEIIKELRF